jgi:hypothetical protein
MFLFVIPSEPRRGYTTMNLTGWKYMDWTYLAEDMDKTDRMNRMSGRKVGWIDGCMGVGGWWQGGWVGR